MRKKLLSGALMIVMSLCVNAQNKMILHQKNGEEVEVLFKDKPVATYEGSKLVISTSGYNLSFEISAIDSLTYSLTKTPVEAVTILNKDAGPTKVYDLNGRLVMTIPADEPVQSSTLPTGIYVIKNNKTSYKLRKQ